MPQYVYSTLKPKVDSFKVVEAKDVKFNDEKSVDDIILELQDMISSGGTGTTGNSNVVIGDTQPSSIDKVWVDTSELNEDEPLQEQTILEQITLAISNLNDKIKALQEENAQMKRDIEYLKKNGGGGIIEDPTTTIENAIIDENSYVLVDENGNYLIYQSSSSAQSIENALVDNDSNIIIDENNNYITF